MQNIEISFLSLGLLKSTMMCLCSVGDLYSKLAYEVIAYWVQLLHTLLPFQTMLSVEHELVGPGAEANEDLMDITLAPLADCPWEV